MGSESKLVLLLDLRPMETETLSMLKALIFDVDGTLAETERDGHRLAFNQAFAEVGLEWNWSVEAYGKLTEIGGGKERIAYYLENFDHFQQLENLHNLPSPELLNPELLNPELPNPELPNPSWPATPATKSHIHTHHRDSRSGRCSHRPAPPVRRKQWRG